MPERIRAQSRCAPGRQSRLGLALAGARRGAGGAEGITWPAPGGGHVLSLSLAASSETGRRSDHTCAHAVTRRCGPVSPHRGCGGLVSPRWRLGVVRGRVSVGWDRCRGGGAGSGATRARMLEPTDVCRMSWWSGWRDDRFGCSTQRRDPVWGCASWSASSEPSVAR